MESQKQDKWPTLVHNKDGKVGRNVKESETGWLIPDLHEALPQKPLPQNCCLLYFPGHLLTSNNKFISPAHPFWLSLRNLTCYCPGTYSSLWQLQSALASHRKNVWNFLYPTISCTAEFHILGIYLAILSIEGEKPKPASNQNSVVSNNWPITQLLQKCKFHVCVTVIAANPGLMSTTFWLLFEWQLNLKTFLAKTANMKVV